MSTPLALPEIQTKLEAILTEVKDHKSSKEKIENDLTAVQADLSKAIEAKADIETVKAIQTQLDAIDAKFVERLSPAAGSTLEQELKEDSRLQDWLKNHRGT